MTDKELKKLNRRELLQLLLEQAKDTERLGAELAAANDHALEMDETFQRLRERLDEKDAKIREMGETYDRLRDRLSDKDAQIQELNDTLQAEREGRMSALSETGSLAEAALQISGVFEAAQKAADLYLGKLPEIQPTPRGAAVPEAVLPPEAHRSAPPPRDGREVGDTLPVPLGAGAGGEAPAGGGTSVRIEPFLEEGSAEGGEGSLNVIKLGDFSQDTTQKGPKVIGITVRIEP